MIEIKGKINTAICYAKVVEEEAIEQIRRMCDYEFTENSKIRIMPDVHAGKGCTIGTTMTVVDKAVPNIVGVDIGCGMFTVNLGKVDIDFEKLISNEKEENVLKLHEYMKNDTGTLKNEYTGMFKDKNLIFILAESFNEIAVNEKLTPTLYKLVNSGFVFENFYSPSIYSTIGGEFQELTTLYASNSNILSSFRKGNVLFPQGIGNMFNKLGYKTFAYHNNTYSFQDRNKYFKSVGLDNYKACGNGLEKLINCKIWPQSDLEMMDATMSDYINEDRFMAYYVSVSGGTNLR